MSTSEQKSSFKKHAFTQTLDNLILRSTSDSKVQVTMNVNALSVNRPEPPKRVSVASALGMESLPAIRAHSIANSIAGSEASSRQRSLYPMEIESNPMSPAFRPNSSV